MYKRQTQGWVGDPPAIAGSADPAFRGDPTRWNPEQLLVAAVSQCHMLWFLHLAVEAGVVVTAYQDRAHGVMAVSYTHLDVYKRQEYVTVLDEGRSTPAPWMNVVANPTFGFHATAEGAGYTLSLIHI